MPKQECGVEEIVRFQKDRLLHLQLFNSKNETTNIFEELLELNGYDVSPENRMKLMDSTYDFIETLKKDGTITKKSKHEMEDEIDALFDIIVFGVGGLLKLGLDVEKVLLSGAKAINSRTGKVIDGKFVKDKDVIRLEPDYSECGR